MTCLFQGPWVTWRGLLQTGHLLPWEPLSLCQDRQEGEGLENECQNACTALVQSETKKTLTVTMAAWV